MEGPTSPGRARSRCELCEARDDLRLFELDPFPAEPDEGRVLLLCGRCRDWLENERIEPVAVFFEEGVARVDPKDLSDRKSVV